jgi:hypothetical protein
MPHTRLYLMQICGNLLAQMKTKRRGGAAAAAAGDAEGVAMGAPGALSRCHGHVGACGVLSAPAAIAQQQAATHPAHAPTQTPASQCAAPEPQSESESAQPRRPAVPPLHGSQAAPLPVNYICAARGTVLLSRWKRVRRTPSSHTTRAGPLVPAVVCAVCGVWCVVCGVWCVVCGVWCVVCGVWCVVCGAFSGSRQSRERIQRVSVCDCIHAYTISATHPFQASLEMHIFTYPRASCVCACRAEYMRIPLLCIYMCNRV